MKGDISDHSISHSNIDASKASVAESIRKSSHNITVAWASQKEFLKLNSVCQNKEKINYAIEKLIEVAPQHINIIKILVEYI